ncbi:ABC transporter permease [Variovorax sp. JS1663]|uniref:ABC transporter permease n=1 Tax=Variovorax sp. JS1663 TaxID=1851577 RepID=UPI000B342AE7|nr:ABC transporter permease [Variovorax sp. JS1663]OUL99985.1 hypothetical protein A8M77_23430 [Variovorax sp. JS1663]
MNAFSWPMRIYLCVMTTFLLAPILIIVAAAFTPGEFVAFPPQGLSLRWFRKVLADPTFMQAIWNSLRLACVSTLFAALLAVPATLAIVRARLPGGRLIQAFMLSPLSLPAIILAIGLLFLNAKLGLSSFWALVAGHSVVIIPYIMRTVFAVYTSANPEIEQASAVHGASPARVFFHVTLPLLKPGLMAGGIFAFLMSLDEVAVSLLLSNTRTTTLPVSILSYLVYNHDPAVAAVSTLQILIAVVALFILERRFGVRNLMFTSR